MPLACVLVHCKPGKDPYALEKIKEMKDVKRAFETLGAFDIVAEFEFKNLEKLGVAVYEIAKIDGVLSTETLIETLL